MEIECPNCKFTSDVPDDIIKKVGVVASCPKCQTKFTVSQPTTASVKKTYKCPKCGANQGSYVACDNCGIIFSKYSNAKDKKDTSTPPRLPQSKTLEQDTPSMLSECHICKNKISRNARKCPSCGEPISGKKEIRAKVILVTLLSLAVCIVAYLYLPKSSKTLHVNNSKKVAQQNKPEIEVVSAVDAISLEDFEFGWNLDNRSKMINQLICFSLKNNQNRKIDSISAHAVIVKNGQVFSEAREIINDLDPDLKSRTVRMETSVGLSISPFVKDSGIDTNKLNEYNMSYKLYIKVDGKEKLVHEGVFKSDYLAFNGGLLLLQKQSPNVENSGKSAADKGDGFKFTTPVLQGQ